MVERAKSLRGIPIRTGLAGLLALVTVLALSPGASAGRSNATPPKVKPTVASGRAVPLAPRIGATAIPGEATRLGFCGGDDWEPEIASDSLGFIYVVWAHFPGDPTCDPASSNPLRVYIQVSDDGGQMFTPPRVVSDAPDGISYPNQIDATVTTNQQGAVFVCFLVYGHVEAPDGVACARSDDQGATFPIAHVISGPECTDCDHEWPAAYGDEVYVAYAGNRNRDHFLARSSDGGRTWTETKVLKGRGNEVAFPEGAVVDAEGNAWFAWGDCTGPCTGRVGAVYRVSRTLAGTSRTDFATVASGPAGPDCPHKPSCGFAYFGPQNDIAIDAAGTLYMVWQDGQDHRKPKSPPIVQLSRCQAGLDCTRSASWVYVGRADDKSARGCPASQCYALFPRIEGHGARQISVIWMDDRLGLPLDHTNGWNVWYRSSLTGGVSWTGPSERVSEFDPSRSESHRNGFEFPYGDYQGIDITPSGLAVMAWGEGHDYAGGPTKPGHVIFGSLPV